MNITENMLLQQMKQMAANMTLPQSGGKKDKAGSSSFQDLMGQTQNTQGSKNTKETADKPKQEQKDQSVQDEAPVQKGEKEELRPEDVVANPNAAILLFRPEVEELLGAGLASTLAASGNGLCASVEAMLDELLPTAARGVPAAAQESVMARFGLARSRVREPRRSRRGRASRRREAAAPAASEAVKR